MGIGWGRRSARGLGLTIGVEAPRWPGCRRGGELKPQSSKQSSRFAPPGRAQCKAFVMRLGGAGEPRGRRWGARAMTAPAVRLGALAGRFWREGSGFPEP
jgi:hypothetical protein